MLTKVIFSLSFLPFILTQQINSLTRANDDDSGCVTQEGRAGTCVRTGSCQTVTDESTLPVCYTLPFFGTKYYCCPATDRPGVYAKSSPGKSICYLYIHILTYFFSTFRMWSTTRCCTNSWWN